MTNETNCANENEITETLLRVRGGLTKGRSQSVFKMLN